MDQLQKIYEAIAAEGYSAGVLALIEDYANDIENGRTNITRFTLPEHAGICTGGTPLIGASVVAGHARASLEASANVAESSGSGPATWQIDEAQEKAIERWAKAARLWVDDSDAILMRTYGPMIAQGAEANVFIDDVTDKPICIDCIVKFV